jgi:hypothetical protein
MSEEERRREAEREKFKGTTFDPRLHNMGGDVGPASIRGSNAEPGGGPDDGPRPDRTAAPAGGHVGAGLDWVSGDEDDPDGGSGRTGEDDGGYLPGEGTGRPFR